VGEGRWNGVKQRLDCGERFYFCFTITGMKKKSSPCEELKDEFAVLLVKHSGKLFYLLGGDSFSEKTDGLHAAFERLDDFRRFRQDANFTGFELMRAKLAPISWMRTFRLLYASRLCGYFRHFSADIIKSGHRPPSSSPAPASSVKPSAAFSSACNGILPSRPASSSRSNSGSSRKLSNP
jgi:hypothetical protein